jgi:uncharacterized membrane protein
MALLGDVMTLHIVVGVLLVAAGLYLVAGQRRE